MFRLLALLQLTRFALAFTAIADAWAILLLRSPNSPPHDMRILIVQMIVTGVVSFGLYGFGMTLNDLLDARRDRIFAPRRPIPSGRINIRSAIIVALLLLMLSLFASAALTPIHIVTDASLTWQDFVPWSFLFAFATAMLIVFYDATSKYLGGLGLVTLGAIRALHCLIGNPGTPYLFLCMFLLTHVIIISTIAYKLENKRPRLKTLDYVTIALGLLVGNALPVAYMFWRGVFSQPLLGMVAAPSLAMLIFVVWAIRILRNKKLAPRQQGERLMLLGLFWLFVYDASMLLGNGQILAGIAITLLLLCAIVSFFGLRLLGRSLNQPKLHYRTQHEEKSPTPRQAN